MAKIRSWEQFDKKMARLGEIEAEVAKASALRDAAVARHNRSFEEISAPLEKEWTKLHDAMEAFYTEHRKDVEDQGVKSRANTLGAAGIKALPDKLEFLDGWNAAKAGETAWKKLPAKLRGVLVKVGYKLQQKPLMAAADKVDLAAMGCRVEKDREAFWVKPEAAVHKTRAA